MRNTKQRECVLNFINNVYTHPTANDVYMEVKKEIPNISLGTVYRLLNKLVEEGKIKRIKMLDNIDRFDHIDDFHAHFLCQKCNNVYDLSSFDDFKISINDHLVVDYEINLKGICRDCKKGME